MKAYKLEIWKTRGELHWHVKSRNGQVIAAGSEGFERYRSVIRSMGPVVAGPAPKRWQHGALGVSVIVDTGKTVWR